MMFSKIIMLLWERWRRTRWAVITACLLTLIEQLMLGAGIFSPDSTAPVILSFGGAGTAILLFVLLVGQCELRSLDLSFPQRLFRFPIRTSILVTTYIGYGIAALAPPTLIRFGFYVLFSEMNSAWTNFYQSQDWSVVEKARQNCRARVLNIAASITGIVDQSGNLSDQELVEQFNKEILVPMGLEMPVAAVMNETVQK